MAKPVKSRNFMVTYTYVAISGQSGHGRSFIHSVTVPVTQKTIMDWDAALKEVNPHFTTLFVSNFIELEESE